MVKAKEKNQAMDFAAIDAAIIAAAKAISAATSATIAKNLSLNTLYIEDMRSATSTGVFHVDGRIKSIIKDKTQRATLLAYVYSFEAKILNATLKKEVSERGRISYKLEVRNFDKKTFTIPDKLNDQQKDFLQTIINIVAFTGLMPSFITEKETLDMETLRTKIVKLCQANGYNLTSELKFSKI